MPEGSGPGAPALPTRRSKIGSERSADLGLAWTTKSSPLRGVERRASGSMAGCGLPGGNQWQT
jgi:hypothetical protein